jgi:TM2 domain-containing membrane protein YozV
MNYADAQNPYAQPAAAAVPPPVAVSTSPALAFALGFIPGVGAIYNGQYLKGLVHAVIFGLIVSLLDSVGHSAGGPLLGIVLAAFIFSHGEAAFAGCAGGRVFEPYCLKQVLFAHAHRPHSADSDWRVLFAGHAAPG